MATLFSLVAIVLGVALGMAVLQGDSAIFGVVQGLTVSASGADLNAIVAPGIGLRSGSGATSDHSDTMWIEQASAYTLSLAAHVSGANPRWVVIEIAEGEANESTVPLTTLPITGTMWSYSTPEGTSCRANDSPSTTSVWPALWPP